MTYSVREHIIRNRQAALETITVANGYDNTIQSVQRFRQKGMAKAKVPMVILGAGHEDAELVNASPIEMIEKTMDVYIGIVYRTQPGDQRGDDEIMNSLMADVEKAWAGDVTCGGYALDSHLASTDPIQVEEGQPDMMELMKFSVHYRNQMADPKTATT